MNSTCIISFLNLAKWARLHIEITPFSVLVGAVPWWSSARVRYSMIKCARRSMYRSINPTISLLIADREQHRKWLYSQIHSWMDDYYLLDAGRWWYYLWEAPERHNTHNHLLASVVWPPVHLNWKMITAIACMTYECTRRRPSPPLKTTTNFLCGLSTLPATPTSIGLEHDFMLFADFCVGWRRRCRSITISNYCWDLIVHSPCQCLFCMALWTITK